MVFMHLKLQFWRFVVIGKIDDIDIFVNNKGSKDIFFKIFQT